ncbi:unnamed protein product [Ambrosiozyma monospora]|uniref:Unnamed protein product n=1 Tax=Ambrosiozyma monospora TaxID=43982 RepID=A0A9W7DL98_AMBMO|nr:unnamed protein product [Ambrosiozyma monospora]
MQSIKNTVLSRVFPSPLNEISKNTGISIATPDHETVTLISNRNHAKFDTAVTDHQSLYNYWVSHPDVILKAVSKVNAEYSSASVKKAVPKTQEDKEFDSYLTDITLKSINLTVAPLIKTVDDAVVIQSLPSLAFDAEKTVEYVSKLLASLPTGGQSLLSPSSSSPALPLTSGSSSNKFKNIIIALPTTYQSMQAAKEIKSKYNVRISASLVYTKAQALLAIESQVDFIELFVNALESFIGTSNASLPSSDSYVKLPLDKHTGFKFASELNDYLDHLRIAEDEAFKASKSSPKFSPAPSATKPKTSTDSDQTIVKDGEGENAKETEGENNG